jgi:hypothetical protein
MNDLRKLMRSSIGVGTWAVAIALAIPATFAIGSIRAHASTLLSGQSATSQSAGTQACNAEGNLEISIDCTYSDAAKADSTAPSVMLNHTKLWFRAKDDSKMRVELTFTNAGKQTIAEARTVYIAVDEESGENHLRRVLPTVDFRKLTPGELVTFSETLRAPAFQAGHYKINLWIPSTDPALKFDPTRNFLLSNPGVPDAKSGLNTIATFTVLK